LAKVLAADRSPQPPHAPGWIPHFLGAQSADEAFFQRKLEEGGCLVMVDGLDEAPERRMRERLARLFENATRTFAKCDFRKSISTRCWYPCEQIALRLWRFSGQVRTFRSCAR